MQRIYLDYSATTPVDKRVLNAMMPYFREKFGNASSIHETGRDAKEALENAREQIARIIRAAPSEIFFTGGGTESDNWALTGYCLNNKSKGNRIVTVNTEHHAVLNTCKFLESQGFEVTYLPVEPDGTIDCNKLNEAITSETLIVSIMHINNEIGTIHDISRIGEITKEKGVVFHSDAVQSFGKIPIDVSATPVDMLSISAHKIYGPKGIGALYIRKGTNTGKFMHGGSHERNQRSGTENVAAAVGFGAAAEICKTEMEQESKFLLELRSYFLEKLKKKIPETRLNGVEESRLPGNLNVSFKDADGESVLLSLDLHGISASSGAACESGSIEQSHVIEALNQPPEYSQSSIRFTLGRWTTRSEIDTTVSVLVDIVERVRSLEEDFA
ncbi:cysteine desulfurase [candidate division KSB1 bacterium]|nr:cysteine desulfurase [candidate division KSB1 bacterium]